jgi:hypothetical protein
MLVRGARGSSVSTVVRLLDAQPALVPSRGRFFCFSSSSALGPTQPPIQWVPGALSPDVKRLEREADHSPSSGAEVKNAWSYTSTPHFMAWCLVKYRIRLYGLVLRHRNSVTKPFRLFLWVI